MSLNLLEHIKNIHMNIVQQIVVFMEYILFLKSQITFTNYHSWYHNCIAVPPKAILENQLRKNIQIHKSWIVSVSYNDGLKKWLFLNNPLFINALRITTHFICQHSGSLFEMSTTISLELSIKQFIASKTLTLISLHPKETWLKTST